MLKYERTYYKRNILLAIIISEILVISAFVFSPKPDLLNRKFIIDEPVFLLSDIPQTRQSSAKKAPPPKLPPINIIDEIDAYETLEDVTIAQGTSNQSDESTEDYNGESRIQYVSSAPRLLYEVVPAGGEDDYHGRLQVSLKINGYGEVIEHRILFNSLDCTDCLNKLIKAAYKSRWQPASVNGQKKPYWVVKSYSFN